MAGRKNRRLTRQCHGCLPRLGLRHDGSLGAPGDTEKASPGTLRDHHGPCMAAQHNSDASLTQRSRVWLKTHPGSLSDSMTTDSGGGSSLRWRNDSCQECCVVTGIGAHGATKSPSISTNPYNIDRCYDATKAITCTTTSQKSSANTITAKDSTSTANRRSSRQGRWSGQHVFLRAVGGCLEIRAVLVVVAMVMGSCQALPTPLPPSSPSTSPSKPPQGAHETTRKDYRVCCGDGVVEMRSVNVTVLRTSPTSVLVSWKRPSIQPLKYEITYKPVNAKYRVVAEVKAPLKSVMLERLLPLTQYQVSVSTVISNKTVWTSPAVAFNTSIEDPNAPGNGTVRIYSTPTILEGVEVGVEDAGASVIDNKLGQVRVRAEEVGIVLLVLAVWMFAIALFFNRWGKIRMLEPYQEPYKETPQQLLQHRPSCPMADQCTLPINSLKRPSLTHTQLEYLAHHHRPRQNSVFVGRSRSHSLEVHPPRRVKSALNLTTLVLQETDEEGAMATSVT